MGSWARWRGGDGGRARAVEQWDGSPHVVWDSSDVVARLFRCGEAAGRPNLREADPLPAGEARSERPTPIVEITRRPRGAIERGELV